MTFDNFVSSRFNAVNSRNIQRRRQIVDNRIQQRLNTFVFESGTAQNRNKSLRNRTFADTFLQSFDRDFLAFKEIFHCFFILFNRSFNQLIVIFFSLVFQLGRNFFDINRRIGGIAGINDCFHLQQIDNTFEFGFGTNRQLQSQRGGTETVFNHIQATIEVCADTIHLVAETNTGNAVFVSLTPNGFGLRFNTGNGVEYGNRTVEHAQGTFNFNREVNVARRINDIDAVSFPETGSCRGSNGNTAFLFLFHPVHGGSTVMGFADFVVYTGIIQNTFSGRCLTGIDVSHDTDVSIHFQFMCTSHCLIPM